MFDQQKKQAEIDKREAQLKEWNSEIQKRQAQLKSAKADAQADSLAILEKQLNQLMASRDAAIAELEKLQQASQSTWDSVVQATDSAFQTASKKFHEFAANNS